MFQAAKVSITADPDFFLDLDPDHSQRFES